MAKHESAAAVTDTEPTSLDAPLFGNENYVSDHKPRREPGQQAMTQAEWLAQALEAQAVLLRGDHVSPELIEDLFLESIAVIQNPPNPPDAVTASTAKKNRE